MAQKWTKNSYFLAKNDPNDPKFGLEVYFKWLSLISKILKIFDNFRPIFVQKTVIFSLTQQKFCNFFRRKLYLVRGKWSKWLKNWYKCTLGSLLQKKERVFWYFSFFWFYGCRNALRWQFWGKILKIFKK